MSDIIVLTEEINVKGVKLLQENYIVKFFSQIEKKDYENVIGLITRTAKVTEDIINMFPNLEVIGKHGVGIDNIRVDIATKKGIKVVNTPNANALSVAEFAISLAFALTKGFFKLNYAMQNHLIKEGKSIHVQNEELKLFGTDLNGKTIGIVGFGKIGRYAAKLALGFGLKIVFYDPYIKELTEPWKGVTQQYQDLSRLMRECDIVTIHIPLTESTRNMFTYELISEMKPTAFLINCSRGGVVNEEDLARCVREKKIAGAGVDVFAIEPPPYTNPLFGLDNVILSSHVAGGTQQSFERMAVDVAQEVTNFLKNGTSKCIVNL